MSDETIKELEQEAVEERENVLPEDDEDLGKDEPLTERIAWENW